MITQAYTYDNLNRLKTSNLNKDNALYFELSNLNYDLNGNITSLNRKLQGITADALTYTYKPNNLNQIDRVEDTGNATFFENKNIGTSDYAYDANGNTTKDLNKGITSLTYNHLNLTQQVVVNGKTIDYVYSATGQKLSANFGNGKKYDYFNGAVYVNDTLEFVPTAEGRWANSKYEYVLKDHLGNARVSCTCDKTKGTLAVLQENHYDPWGLSLPIGVEGKDRYKFQGQEEIPELGWYDFGNRIYDPATVHWNRPDRFADKYYNLSPYSAFGGNPLLYTDMNGDSLMKFKNGSYMGMFDNGKKEITGYNQVSTIDKDGKETFTGGQSFGFNDIDLDKGKLKSGDMTLNFMSSKDLENVIASSGAEKQGVFSRWVHASTESNAGNTRGKGKMDMKGKVTYSTLNIIDGVGYNNADAGNYFWGYAMRKMGYSEPSLYVGSNVNAWWSAKESNRQGSSNPNAIIRWFENRSWGGDSEADQKAIYRGMNAAGNYWSNKLKSLRR